MKWKSNPFSKFLIFISASCAGYSLNCSPSDANSQDGQIVQPGDPSLNIPHFKSHKAKYKNVNKKNEFVGMITTELKPGTVHGKAVFWWICSIEMKKNTIIDSVAFDPITLAPVYRSFPHSKKGYHFLSFTGNKVAVKVKPFDDIKMQSFTIQFERPVFDSSLLDYVLAALPLQKDYSVKIPYGDYNRKKTAWAFAKVVRKEEITSEKGKSFNAWVVEMEFSNGGKRTLWITNKVPFRVKSAGGWNWELIHIQVEE